MLINFLYKHFGVFEDLWKYIEALSQITRKMKNYKCDETLSYQVLEKNRYILYV